MLSRKDCKTDELKPLINKNHPLELVSLSPSRTRGVDLSLLDRTGCTNVRQNDDIKLAVRERCGNTKMLSSGELSTERETSRIDVTSSTLGI